MGCRKEEIQVYEVPKEKAPPMHASRDPHGASAGAGARSALKWGTLPPGWRVLQEGQNEMRQAMFAIEGKEGKSAQLAVIAIPGMAGSDLEFVNMWRKQIGLGEVQESDLGRYVQPVKIGDGEGKLYDMRGSEGGQSTDPNGVLVAMLVKDGVAWFFKLGGSDDLVQSQRGALTQFLQGVSFEAVADDGAMAAMAGPGVGGPPSRSGGDEGGAMPEWTVPEAWKPGEPGPMILRRFVLGGGDSGRADVTVSRFAGPAGGLAANVNRWRNQLGLAPVSADALGQQSQSIQVDGRAATLVDFSGTDAKSGGRPARVIGVIVPREGETWFFKLLGDPTIAEREKNAFVQFVQSAKYSHVP